MDLQCKDSKLLPWWIHLRFARTRPVLEGKFSLPIPFPSVLVLLGRKGKPIDLRFAKTKGELRRKMSGSIRIWFARTFFLSQKLQLKGPKYTPKGLKWFFALQGWNINSKGLFLHLSLHSTNLRVVKHSCFLVPGMAPPSVPAAQAVRSWLECYEDGAVWHKQLGQAQREAARAAWRKSEFGDEEDDLLI